MGLPNMFWNILLIQLTSVMFATFDFLDFFSAFIVLFAVIDPIGAIPIVISVREQGKAINAFKAVAYSLFLMCLFFFMGEGLLNLFGVDINSFAVAGALGHSTVETGFIWSDLITDFERVSDHCSNIAVGMIDVSEHTMNAHEVIKHLKDGNARYNEKLEEYSNKYSVVKLV